MRTESNTLQAPSKNGSKSNNLKDNNEVSFKIYLKLPYFWITKKSKMLDVMRIQIYVNDVKYDAQCAQDEMNMKTVWHAYLEILSENHPKVSFCPSRKGKPADDCHSQSATVRYNEISPTIKKNLSSPRLNHLKQQCCKTKRSNANLKQKVNWIHFRVFPLKKTFMGTSYIWIIPALKNNKVNQPRQTNCTSSVVWNELFPTTTRMADDRGESAWIIHKQPTGRSRHR